MKNTLGPGDFLLPSELWLRIFWHLYHNRQVGKYYDACLCHMCLVQATASHGTRFKVERHARRTLLSGRCYAKYATA